MNRRKEISHEYKQRKLQGGVYTITNTLNGKYLIAHTANLKSIQNRFEFSLTTGGAAHPKLQKDWTEHGSQAFKLEVLEELEPQPAQNELEFMEDLKTLEQLWRAKLDPSKEY